MKRKVVQIAGFTKVVSLPSKWVKAQGIQKGDELDIKEEGSTLLVSVESRDKIKKATVDLTKADKFLKRFVNIYYRLGYDEVDIKLKEPHQANLIQQEVSNRLLGFEIVTQKDNFCSIRSIAKGIEEEFDVILRRVFLILNSMATEGLDAIKKKDLNKLQNLVEIDIVLNKFTNFCQRTLNMKGYTDDYPSTVIYFVVTSLEMISDRFVEIYKEIIHNKFVKMDKRILELFKVVTDMLNIYYNLFYSFKVDKLIEFDNRWKDIITKNEYWFKDYSTTSERFIIHQLHSIGFSLHHLTDMTYKDVN